MDQEYYQRLAAYRSAMSLALAMQERGIISEKDYAKIDTIMAKKYRINSGSIFR